MCRYIIEDSIFGEANSPSFDTYEEALQSFNDNYSTFGVRVGDFVRLLKVIEPDNFFSEKEVMNQKYINYSNERGFYWDEPFEMLIYSILKNHDINSDYLFKVQSHSGLVSENIKAIPVILNDGGVHFVHKSMISDLREFDRYFPRFQFFNSLTELDVILEKLLPIRKKELQDIISELHARKVFFEESSSEESFRSLVSNQEFLDRLDTIPAETLYVCLYMSTQSRVLQSYVDFNNVSEGKGANQEKIYFLDDGNHLLRPSAPFISDRDYQQMKSGYFATPTNVENQLYYNAVFDFTQINNTRTLFASFEDCKKQFIYKMEKDIERINLLIERIDNYDPYSLIYIK